MSKATSQQDLDKSLERIAELNEKLDLQNEAIRKKGFSDLRKPLNQRGKKRRKMMLGNPIRYCVAKRLPDKWHFFRVTSRLVNGDAAIRRYKKKGWAQRRAERLACDFEVLQCIRRESCSNLAMTTGNESIFFRIVLDGIRKDWVGFGWVDCGDATDRDYRNYPIVF